MALRMDMDVNIPLADKCSAKVISKFLLVVFLCDNTHQCSIPALDKCDKLTPKKQMLIHCFTGNNIITT
jgi:hypothetical protein